MYRGFKLHGGSILILAAAVVLSACPVVEAAAKAKPRKHIFDDLVTPSMLSQAAPVRAGSAPTTSARLNGPKFFSINGVLAKLEGRPDPGAKVQVAMAANNDVMTDAPAGLPQIPGTSQEPYGLVSFRAPEGALWKKWRNVSKEMEADTASLAACRNDIDKCSAADLRFQAMIEAVSKHDGRGRIETANRLVNGAVRYTSDLSQHGVIDHWSSALETLGWGRGDCEDYAIAKYVLLRSVGVPDSDLRILLGRDRAAREDHAVLAVKAGASWIILDNRSANTSADADFTHFTPLYAVDQAGVSLFASPYLSGLNLRGNMTPAAAKTDSQADALDWGSGDDIAAGMAALTSPAEPSTPFLL